MSDQEHPATTDLGAALTRLPRTMQPERDLWPTIAQRLAPRTVAPAKPRYEGWMVGLAAAALLTIGMGLGYLLRGETGSMAPGTVASGSGAREASGAGAMDLANASSASAPRGAAALAAYRAATAELRSDLALRGMYLPPQTRSVVQRELAVIEAAIAEVERAFAASPADPHLERMLLTRYRQQVDLLTRWLPVNAGGGEWSDRPLDQSTLGGEELTNEGA